MLAHTLAVMAKAADIFLRLPALTTGNFAPPRDKLMHSTLFESPIQGSIWFSLTLFTAMGVADQHPNRAAFCSI